MNKLPVDKRTLSPAQARVLSLLRQGYVIVEESGRNRHCLSYWTAQINSQHPHAMNLSKPVHKGTVFALLAAGLLKLERPWKGDNSQVMALNEALPLLRGKT